MVNCIDLGVSPFSLNEEQCIGFLNLFLAVSKTKMF
jgi:hypothetical protein